MTQSLVKRASRAILFPKAAHNSHKTAFHNHFYGAAKPKSMAKAQSGQPVCKSLVEPPLFWVNLGVNHWMSTRTTEHLWSINKNLDVKQSDGYKMHAPVAKSYFPIAHGLPIGHRSILLAVFSLSTSLWCSRDHKFCPYPNILQIHANK